MSLTLAQELRNVARYNETLLRRAADRINALENAIEVMRISGSSAEFQLAFDRAKALLKDTHELSRN
jgi:hypothetical protein